ncbi:TPA: hypothetical protein N0F65_008089 [Lagenidium giganteum]|uniref:NAD-dependent epimerase/dehydratase domain-containing protein n=1 Tax=Lagenidium giganteum TaxID=4803 RepID=A0AAV2Z1G4_9STRA|nr:TPA: hypothetical protein N0F65_008089 [Lagenidium giganteum]
MRVLVLGGSSYVAQFVLRGCLDANAIVASGSTDATTQLLTIGCTLRTPAAALSGGDDTRLPSQFHLVQHGQPPPPLDGCHDRVWVFPATDVTDQASISACLSCFQPDVVINCVGEMEIAECFRDNLTHIVTAALSSPAACEKQPELARAINHPTALLAALADASKLRGAAIRLLHFSTDLVYGGAVMPAGGYSEADASMATAPPTTVYGQTKLMFDEALMAQHDCCPLVLRIANVVGPPAPLFRNQLPKFIEWLHKQLFESNDQPVRLWSDEIRSFVFVQDIVGLVLLLLQRDNECWTANPIINVGGAESLSRVQVAEQYIAVCNGRSIRREHAPLAAVQRASVDIGYSPPLDATLNTSRQIGLIGCATPTQTWMEEIASAISRIT